MSKQLLFQVLCSFRLLLVVEEGATVLYQEEGRLYCVEISTPYEPMKGAWFILFFSVRSRLRWWQFGFRSNWYPCSPVHCRSWTVAFLRRHWSFPPYFTTHTWAHTHTESPGRSFNLLEFFAVGSFGLESLSFSGFYSRLLPHWTNERQLLVYLTSVFF